MPKKKTSELAVFDSFFNLVAQLGTTKDKRAHGTFGYREIDDFQLENMYEFDWLSGKVIDSPSYLVKKVDEGQIEYALNSPFREDVSKIWGLGKKAPETIEEDN